MSFQTLVTTIGIAKIADALANNTAVALHSMAIGDGAGNPTTPVASQTALVREVYRAELNSLTLDPDNPSNFVIAEMVVPTTVGGWTVREFGLFDSAGALIAVGNFPDTYKPVAAEGSTRDLIVRVRIEVSSTAAVTLTIDPSVVLASRQWVLDNFSLAGLIPGGAAGEVLRKKSSTAGDVEWYDPTSGFTATIDVVEEYQVLAAAQTVVTFATVDTGAAAVYVDGLRLRGPESASPQYAINSSTQITLATAATAGQQLHAVENDPAAPLTFLHKDNLLSEIAAKGAAAKATARANLGISTDSALQLAILQAVYPVGALFLSTVATNPATLFGFGTWEAYGSGKVPVAIDTTDTDFATLGQTGGAKRVALTTANLPDHYHSVPGQTVTTSTTGGHTHASGDFKYLLKKATESSTVTDVDFTAGEPDVGAGGIAEMASSGNHNHTVTVPATNTGSTGSGQSHSNVQPYIVVAMWRRTA